MFTLDKMEGYISSKSTKQRNNHTLIPLYSMHYLGWHP